MAQFFPKRKEPEGSWVLAELEESLAVTSGHDRLGERLKASTGLPGGYWPIRGGSARIEGYLFQASGI